MPTRRAILYRCEHNPNTRILQGKCLRGLRTVITHELLTYQKSNEKARALQAASAYKRRDFWRETHTPLWQPPPPLVMNRKGPWEGYRPLSPSRLPLRARFKERRLGTRQPLWLLIGRIITIVRDSDSK